MSERTNDMSINYGGREALGRWEWSSKEASYYLPEQSFHVLKAAGIIPPVERLDGWVFFSPSSNYKIFEEAFLDAISLSAEDATFKVKPLVITSDIAGYYDDAVYSQELSTEQIRQKGWPDKVFKPTFKEHLAAPNADYLNIASDAYDIPLAEHSVNVIWDRLGAIWHAAYEQENLYTPTNTNFVELFHSYERILKPDGCIIVDAYEDYIIGYPAKSTFTRISKELDDTSKDALSSWDITLIGDGATRMAVLQRKK